MINYKEELDKVLSRIAGDEHTPPRQQNEHCDKLRDEESPPPPPAPNKNQPWGQRRNEPDDKYLAFQVYLDLGSKRSYKTAAIRLGRTKNTIYNWSNTYDWLERADAYDKHQYLELKAKMKERFEEEIEKNYETNLRLSKLSAEIVNELVYSLAQYDSRFIDELSWKKLRYTQLLCKTIKEVRSLINFFPEESPYVKLELNDQYISPPNPHLVRNLGTVDFEITPTLDEQVLKDWEEGFYHPKRYQPPYYTKQTNPREWDDGSSSLPYQEELSTDYPPSEEPAANAKHRRSPLTDEDSEIIGTCPPPIAPQSPPPAGDSENQSQPIQNHTNSTQNDQINNSHLHNGEGPGVRLPENSPKTPYIAGAKRKSYFQQE